MTHPRLRFRLPSLVLLATAVAEADASGHYSSQVVAGPVTMVVGGNFTIVPGGSIQL
jgi:hypothetical protein